MKYSIIFPYRNREEHLNINLPQIKKIFAETDHEIIIVEQNDNLPFCRGTLFNIGANSSNGDILILHDVDYYPTDDVEYYDNKSDVFLPVQYATFCYNNLTPKPINEVPAGYQHFKNGVDSRIGKRVGEQPFFGAIEVIKKEIFFKINGFDSKLRGWGNEDSILRERAIYYNYTWHRHPTNQFLVLDHPDSGPPAGDNNFINNASRSQNWKRYLNDGLNNQKATIEEITPKHQLVDKWILAAEFDEKVETHIITSTF